MGMADDDYSLVYVGGLEHAKFRQNPDFIINPCYPTSIYPQAS